MPYGCKWVHENDEPPGIPKVGLHEPKKIVVIFWNINGIALLKIHPPSVHINSTIFIKVGYPIFVEAKKSWK